MGVNFGGDSGKKLSDAFDAKRFTWGVSLTWMGGGVFGVEGDVGYSPDFFGKTDLGGSSVLTATGNLLLGIPFGGQQGFGFRPYGLVGVGVVRAAGVRGAVRHRREQRLVELRRRRHAVLRQPCRPSRRRQVFPHIRRVKIAGIDLDLVERPGKVDFTRGSVGLILRF